MSKKERLFNSILVLLGYAVPILILRIYDGSGNIYRAQLICYPVILIAGIILFVMNRKFSKKAQKRAYFIFFEVLGVVGCLFAASVLYFVFAFMNFSA